MRWRDDAACRGATGPAWDRDEPTLLTYERCSVCPVRVDCLAEAMDRHWTEDVGIWGFTTPRQRRALRQKKTTLAEAWRESQEWLTEARRVTS